MSFFRFLKFVMNSSKGVVSICHSFRSTGQLGRINGFDRYFQVFDRYHRQPRRTVSEIKFINNRAEYVCEITSKINCKGVKIFNK